MASNQAAVNTGKRKSNSNESGLLTATAVTLLAAFLCIGCICCNLEDMNSSYHPDVSMLHENEVTN